MTRLDGALDVLRVMIFPANDDQVFDAPGDVELRVAQETEIAGAQPRTAAVGVRGVQDVARVVGLCPVTGRDVRAAYPDFADGVLRQRRPRLGLDDPQLLAFDRGAAAHETQRLPRAFIGGDRTARAERIGIDIEITRTGTCAASRREQRRLRHAVARVKRLAPQPAAGERRREPVEGARIDRLGAAVDEFQTAQVERRLLLGGHHAGAQIESEIRRAGRARAVMRERRKPAHRPLEKTHRRHQHRARAEIQRLEQVSDQPHVMVDRQPANERRLLVITELAADHGHVRHDVPVRDHHAARLAGGAGAVLEQRERVAAQRRRLPAIARREIDLIAAQQRKRPRPLTQPRLDLQPGVAGRDDRPHLRVGQNRLDAWHMADVARRISRDGDDPRIQTPEERRHEFQSRGLQQQHAVAGSDARAQDVCDSARPGVERGVVQHLSRLLAFRQEMHSRVVGVRFGAGPQKLDKAGAGWVGQSAIVQDERNS